MSTSIPVSAPVTAGAGRRVPRSRTGQRLEARLRGLAGKAIADFSMIGDGDRVMACVSGGKDSFAMLDLLLSLQRSAPVSFSVTAVNLDQKQPGFPAERLPRYCAERGIPFEVIEQDTYAVVRRVLAPGKNTCGLCSRLRRGALYAHAARHRYTRIALGHHRDDILETFFLNLFHGGRLKAMPPKLLSDDQRHVVIRPLAYCRERDLARFARERRYPLIPCDLCGSQPRLERQRIKQMIAHWDREAPGRSEVMFRALQHVSPSQLADRALFDFDALSAAGDDAG